MSGNVEGRGPARRAPAAESAPGQSAEARSAENGAAKVRAQTSRAARGEAAKHERERRIVAAAREVAAAEGWRAVTTRRLATEIGFTQPVIYSHFASMGDVMAAAAIEGFDALADATDAAVAAVTAAGAGADGPDAASDSAQFGSPGVADRATRASHLEAGARAYLDFARREPALYEAMFSRATGLRFATSDAPKPLRRGFATVAAQVGGDPTRAEVLWSALHGLAELDRAGRLRADAREARLAVLVELFTG
ncbi:MAG: TetR-like C-terminal domain-containing protein [Pseudoclavibacter sp.]